ncbi:hypothetical protein HETIRDRAFT_449129 [Heterobasidion irregulare TC 32-1]|uniref:Uncharacterized protein n=1 Tax=Heterobasidion irregulare (strain TC 32-1) TaxID=747525 RepID=W4KMI3_HETIT|nr:uncharacterized protein HETIRDRAFT_449129 [Heterobasidion irregulare TC 32-1]ETW86261.1 hypothetical protein HETIRDRAFT_449129 [Heterobasidion irregulare TC 32-1]
MRTTIQLALSASAAEMLRAVRVDAAAARAAHAPSSEHLLIDLRNQSTGAGYDSAVKSFDPSFELSTPKLHSYYSTYEDSDLFTIIEHLSAQTFRRIRLAQSIRLAPPNIHLSHHHPQTAPSQRHPGPPIPRRPNSSFSATSLRKNRLAPTPPPRSSGTRADLPAHHQLRECTPFQSFSPQPGLAPELAAQCPPTPIGPAQHTYRRLACFQSRAEQSAEQSGSWQRPTALRVAPKRRSTFPEAYTHAHTHAPIFGAKTRALRYAAAYRDVHEKTRAGTSFRHSPRRAGRIAVLEAATRRAARRDEDINAHARTNPPTHL